MQLTKWTDLARKLPSPIYKILSQSYIDKSFPRHLFIETTANCNLSCAYCPREKIKEDMDFELFKAIIDEASTYGKRSFSLHLFGEPLLYPKIIDAISYIKRANRGHTILLTTNGTLLNKYSSLLGEVDRIIWSYRKNNFDEVSIKLLKKKGLIRLLIEETPKEEFEKWSKFPRVEIKHLHNYGGNIDISKWGLKDDTKGSMRWPCYHLWLAPAIRHNGEITICCNVPERGKEVLGVYPKTTLGQAWKSEKLASIRESHMKGQYLGACANCDSYKAYPNIFWGHEFVQVRNK